MAGLARRPRTRRSRTNSANAREHHASERGPGEGLAICAVADHHLLGINLRLVCDEATVAAPFDSHAFSPTVIPPPGWRLAEGQRVGWQQRRIRQRCTG